MMLIEQKISLGHSSLIKGLNHLIIQLIEHKTRSPICSALEQTFILDKYFLFCLLCKHGLTIIYRAHLLS